MRVRTEILEMSSLGAAEPKNGNGMAGIVSAMDGDHRHRRRSAGRAVSNIAVKKRLNS